MLTREDQEEILCPVVIAYRLELWGGKPRPTSYAEDMDSFRAALRLDDPKLAEIIAKGAPLTWTTPSCSPAST